MIIQGLKEVETVNRTGPIDDPVVEYAGDCPKCDENSLFYYPDQHGFCHSGIYSVHWPEHYGCDNPDCCALFVEQA